jgi:hypothetical protein
MSGFCDLSRLAFRAVIAPQIIFPERPKIFANGNHGRTRGVECDGLHLISRNAGFLQGLTRRSSQCTHVVVVRLGGVFRIFALAVQRVLDAGGVNQAALAVDQRNTNAQGSEVDSGHDRHQQAPFSQL